jgi:hypothetical protein
LDGLNDTVIVNNDDGTSSDNNVDQSGCDAQIGNFLNDKNSLGPVHFIMELASLGKMHKIYNFSNGVVYVFVVTALCHAVGKSKWNKYCTVKKLGACVHCSDEAYAMVCLENNVDKWLEK